MVNTEMGNSPADAFSIVTLSGLWHVPVIEAIGSGREIGLINGIGQALNTSEVLDGLGVKLNKASFVAADPVTRRTSLPWLYAGGDAVVGPWSVVGAIADGEKAAIGIDTLFNGRSDAFWRTEKAADTLFDPDADPTQYPRAKMQLIPVNKRRNNFQEVELPWSEAVARREAKRCLRCDYRQPAEQK